MKPGCGFPGVHVLLRMDLSAGFIDDFVAGPCAAHDLSSASRLHGSMGEPDRVSLIDTLDALRHADAPPGTIATIDLWLNPDRPNRTQPRVIKRRKDRYSYMTKPRDQLKRALLGASDEVSS